MRRCGDTIWAEPQRRSVGKTFHPQMTQISQIKNLRELNAKARRGKENVLDCGGKRTATPLWNGSRWPESGAAAALPTAVKICILVNDDYRTVFLYRVTDFGGILRRFPIARCVSACSRHRGGQCGFLSDLVVCIRGFVSPNAWTLASWFSVYTLVIACERARSRSWIGRLLAFSHCVFWYSSARRFFYGCLWQRSLEFRWMVVSCWQCRRCSLTSCHSPNFLTSCFPNLILCVSASLR